MDRGDGNVATWWLAISLAWGLASPALGDPPGHHHHRHDGGDISIGYAPPTAIAVPAYPLYSSYAYPAYGYPVYGYAYPFALPPLYLPAETLYGPEPVKRLMGIDNWAGAPPAADLAVNRTGFDAPPEAKPPRGSNRESVALAQRFIGFGDANFGSQRWNEALQRFRKAAEISPGLADAWFRQGYALLALGRYEAAAKAIRRGLALNPQWPNSGFKNAMIYGGNMLAKNAHLEALAQAIDDNPQNADLIFLLGVAIYFDDKPDRAKPFFERLKQLSGETSEIKAFLANMP